MRCFAFCEASVWEMDKNELNETLAVQTADTYTLAHVIGYAPH